MKQIPLADSDAWNNATGESRGKPVTIRYRPGLERFLGDARYPQRLTILWDYGESALNGLPSDKQSEDMREFEDLLQSQLDTDRLAVLAFVHTRAGIRRWNYYVSDMDLVRGIIHEARSTMPDVRISLEVEDDANWDEMRLLLKQCK